MPSPAQQVEETLRGAKIHSTDYAGGALFWQQWTPLKSPTAPPLVLLHGGFGSWNHWFLNLSELRQQREVWTLDLPGLGQSGDMPPPYTTQHFAEVVWSGLQQLLGREQVFALGSFSFGSMIAAQLAILAGTRCYRCTLIGAAGFGDLHVQVPLLAPPKSEVEANEAERIQRENLQRLMIFDTACIDEMAVYLHSINLRHHRYRSRSLAKTNELAELLPKIPATLVGVWGSEDATAGGADAIEARRQLFLQAQPESEFHVIPNAGHWVMYEMPDRVNAILLDER